jgi:hypothetical protein
MTPDAFAAIAKASEVWAMANPGGKAPTPGKQVEVGSREFRLNVDIDVEVAVDIQA